MPDASFLSMTGAKAEATAGKTTLAASVLHLFKFGFNPNVNSTLADFLGQECDFDGYAPVTIATWADPILAGAGYLVYAPTQTFRWEHDVDDVGNQVGGAFLVLAGGTLYQYSTFDPTRPCQGPDQAIVITPADFYPAG